MQPNLARKRARQAVAFSPEEAKERHKKRSQDTATQATQKIWSTVVGHKSGFKRPAKTPRQAVAAVKNLHPGKTVGKDG